MMDPTDGPRIFTREYYQRLHDLEQRFWWNAGMRDAAELLLRRAALPMQGLILDVGCGSGQTMAWFTNRYPGWRAIGVDIALDAVRAAGVLFPGRVVQASGLALPIAKGTADLVSTLDMLQHLPLAGGDAYALAEIARVLKPGGHLLLRTNAQAFPHADDDSEFNFHKYDPGELRAKLETAGLTVRRLGRLNALLGLAEIPRELRRRAGGSYRGVLATPRDEPDWRSAIKRGWLRLEGRVIAAGYGLPFGRSILALCQRTRGT
jgi:SAM-dependent methyltransferase